MCNQSKSYRLGPLVECIPAQKTLSSQVQPGKHAGRERNIGMSWIHHLVSFQYQIYSALNRHPKLSIILWISTYHWSVLRSKWSERKRCYQLRITLSGKWFPKTSASFLTFWHTDYPYDLYQLLLFSLLILIITIHIISHGQNTPCEEDISNQIEVQAKNITREYLSHVKNYFMNLFGPKEIQT